MFLVSYGLSFFSDIFALISFVKDNEKRKDAKLEEEKSRGMEIMFFFPLVYFSKNRELDEENDSFHSFLSRAEEWRKENKSYKFFTIIPFSSGDKKDKF